MNATRRDLILQRWHVIQHEVLPELKQDLGQTTPKLERLIHLLEWVRIEEFVASSWCGVGRRPHDRAWLANAFVAKAALGLTTTAALIERLMIDRALRRICGFPLYRKLPSEATFSRAFEEFATTKLAERVHETLIKTHLGDQLIGHISRDGTAIKARERPVRGTTATATNSMSGHTPCTKRGGPRRDEKCTVVTRSPIERQRGQCLAEMLAEIPTACDRGTKSNAQGYKVSWNGYKLHLDTADCGVPISALLSAASMHDSRAAIPLSLISAERVTNLYDVMDAAYCSLDLHEHCRSLNHVPLIDHNPRGGLKESFDPADAVRYNERTVAERSNARLKDEFGGNQVRVQGAAKVMSHLMFGVLVLSADQLMRLLL
ncbi:MAG: transposase [Pseudomonadales bacterium]|jgi:IS5 family transposase|nr:transposase [Pseudomonadales bacterium]MCB9358284.1 transposase [Calditrichota bacterium]MCP5319264.1 transposase [Pseudomonadales bacterium]MCP5319675.1 transposase [Pseudomonadales bacterium]MCP5337409.1 transposase [Pseudomonadales bacterium]